MEISIQRNRVKYSPETLEFRVSGLGIEFGTSHILKNEKTGGTMGFNLSHSTGYEWDPKTMWVYKSETGLKLIIGNEDVTEERKEAYLKAKTERK